MQRRLAPVTALALLFAALPAASRGAPAIDVLSNRSDLVSGGDVLIEVVLPPATPPSSVVLLNNGSPATAVSGVDVDGRLLARVTGLVLGTNLLTAQLPGGAEASASVVNHPTAGRCSRVRRSSRGRVRPARSMRSATSRPSTPTCTSRPIRS